MKHSSMAVLCGALVPVMIMINGELTRAVGNYSATVIIHVVGLVAVLAAFLFTRQKLHPGKRLPLYLYLGGVVGVFSVLFNNHSYAVLGVSLSLALGLLGQLVFSLVIDRFGLLGMPAQPFRPERVLSAVLVLIGILFMMIG